MSHKGMKHCNPIALAAQAPAIVARMRAGSTFTAEMTALHCGYEVLARAVLAVISRDELEKILHANRRRHGKRTGFQPGSAPWNTGLKGWCPPGSRATQFKPGTLRGKAARSWRPVGTIVTRTEAPRAWYLRSEEFRATHANVFARYPRRRFIKIRDDGPPQNRYVPLARWLWERDHGPVPAGKFVAHFDGNTMNDDPKNLVLITHRAALAHLGVIHPDVVAERIRKCGKITSQRWRDYHAQQAGMKQIRAEAGAGDAPDVHRHRGPTRVQRKPMCAACGGDRSQIPDDDPCPKCGGSAIDR